MPGRGRTDSELSDECGAVETPTVKTARFETFQMRNMDYVFILKLVQLSGPSDIDLARPLSIQF